MVLDTSPFRSAEELEARQVLHEAIGRFVVAFELMLSELRNACRLMLERNGLRNQSLANIDLARISALEVTTLVGTMYREFRPHDDDGARALHEVLKRVDELRINRNNVVHSAWTLGVHDDQGTMEPLAHSLSFGKTRTSGQTVRELSLRPADFDDLTVEATKLQVYGIRVCHSVNQADLELAAELARPL